MINYSIIIPHRNSINLLLRLLKSIPENHNFQIIVVDDNSDAPFVKELKNLNFNKIQIFRPPSLIRQTELIRSSEKKSIKFVQILNKFGFLKSFKPLPVEFLAKKMVEESLLNKKTCVKTYKPEECY